MLTPAALLLLLLPAVQDAQAPVLAIRVARAETVSGGAIEGATILVEGGKIVAVGEKVPVPRGAKEVDATDLVAVPGWVVPFSRFTVSPGRSRGTNAQLRVMDEIDRFDEVWGEILRRGVTTVAVAPYGAGIAGQGAVLRPDGEAAEALVPSAFLSIDLALETASKQLLRQALENGKKEIERLEKAKKEAEKKAESRPATRPATRPSAESRPATRPAPETRPATRPARGPATRPAKEEPPKPDPKLEPLVRLLKKELRALVSLDGPAEVLHFLDAARGFEFERAIVGASSLHLVADRLAETKESVVLPPEITFAPFTRNRVNAAAVLLRAGVRIAFVPSPATRDGIEAYPFRVGELVKAGLPRDAALRAMTLAPAEMLGVADRVGSLEEGKEADVLFFDRDPFDPAARLRRVLLGGTFVEMEE